jgi:hypothetical protein
VAIFYGGEEGTLYAFGNTKERPRFGDGFVLAAAQPSGEIVIATAEGRLVLVTPR